MALNFLNLCHAQACGKCAPCRIGPGQPSALPEIRIPADAIVVAIGQGIETEAFEQSGIPIHRGAIGAMSGSKLAKADMDGIFAGGDCVTGPASVIKAIAAGKVAALKRLGFGYVFDTNFAADLTIMEEGTEFVEQFTHRDQYQWPVFTSCCPRWGPVREIQLPCVHRQPLRRQIPQRMFGAVAKSYFAEKMGLDPRKIRVVSIMACPGGCARSGGQPIVGGVEMAEYQGGALWAVDKAEKIRFSHENSDVQALYRDYLEKPPTTCSTPTTTPGRCPRPPSGQDKWRPSRPNSRKKENSK